MTLIFDTETNGKADFKADPCHDNQPRLVQLAGLLLDEELEPVAEMNVIIKPNGFIISDEVAKIHGITQSKAEKYGVEEAKALHLFSDLLHKATKLVAHNIKFDNIVLLRALFVNKIVVAMPTHHCTMAMATPVCKLPGFGGQYKWPSLQEAHKIIMGVPFDNAHDAMADVRACARIYEKLIHGDRPAKPVTTRDIRPPIDAGDIAEEEYDDNTLMPFGKYKGTPLCKLPESYCNWLYEQQTLSDRKLHAWLHGN